MITDKKFIVTDGQNKSTLKFNVWNGLQQGMVNSPILYNIYSSDLVRSLGNGIAYADDLIIYTSGNKAEKIQQLLQNDSNKIQKYCDDWKLKINIKKCEVILFRTPLSKACRNIKKNWKNLKVSQSHTGQLIEQKTEVKYLGIILDQYLYYNKHINNQLQKAKNAFNKIRRLFFSKHLVKRVKIISYMTLIRPIIIYGCPVWFNISPSYMERIRVFERHCLRACLSMYRDCNSNYNHYFSNQRIYNGAEINRVDNFIIKQIRNHFVRAATIENSLIRGPTCPLPLYHARAIDSGYIPPESFIYLDEKGMIQDTLGVPVIYHYYRSATNKKIEYSPQLQSTDNSIPWRFNMKISKRDILDNNNLNRNKYWWFQNLMLN